MIVRILGDQQYRLDDAAYAKASAIDDRVQAAAEANEPEEFRAALGDLVAEIRASGQPLAVDELTGSDAVVPSPDTSLDEAMALLSTEGLIPN